MTAQMNSEQTSRGFTLVELLVVIAIIGMLAGLMLPAVQQAREAGRRAECLNNQRNVALACFGYDSACKSLPGLTQTAGDVRNGTWYYAIFPYIEQTNLYERLQTCKGNCANEYEGHAIWKVIIEHSDVKDTAIAVFKCPSASDERNSSRVNFIANAGRCNVTASGLDWDDSGKTYEAGARASIFVTHSTGTYHTTYETGSSKDTVFLDQSAYKGAGKKSSVEYIAGKNGTSHTILTSESEDAASWYNNQEPQVGFCYGFIITAVDAGGNITASDSPGWETPSSGSLTDYAADAGFPYWINSGRKANKDLHRKARPSSPHPGVVVSTFCDGSTRPISDGMNKSVFKAAMQPNSGYIFSANDLN
ncbi:MAG: DUF1559 domain-containing protein [Thermoguttaceae bacterium]